MSPYTTNTISSTRVPPLASLDNNPLLNNNSGALSPAELQAGIDAFEASYQLADGHPVPGQVVLPFQSLQDTVALFMRQENMAEADVACRFIHRFAAKANEWFTTLELCSMKDLKTTDAYGRAEYAVKGYAGYRYDIRNGISAGTLQGDYDPEYFNSIYYKDISVTPLEHGVQVQSVTVPWMRELLRLCQHNDLESVAGAKLVIESIANPPAHQGDTLVARPHSLAFFMRDAQGTNRLGPRTGQRVFHNQAADIATACPTACSNYLMPPGLPA